MLCERAGIPETLRSLYARLMIVPPDTPLPMTMLKRLWNFPAEDKAEAMASLFESKVPAPITAIAVSCRKNIISFCIMYRKGAVSSAAKGSALGVSVGCSKSL